VRDAAVPRNHQLILSLEKKSRRTSESGKMAPSISDHVIMRPRFIGVRRKHVLPAEDGLPNQSAGNAMCDRVHGSSLSDVL